MLFYKLDEDDFEVLKTFLLFLNFMPKIIRGIGTKDLLSSDVSVDLFVGKRLRDV
jgi:hypothetical protein